MATNTKSQKELNDQLEKEIALRKEIAKVAQTNKKLIDLEIDARRKKITQIRESNVLMAEAIATGEKDSMERQKFIRDLTAQLGGTEKLTDAQKELIESLDQTSESLRKGIRDSEGLADAQAKIADSAEAARDLGTAFGEAAGELLGIDKNWKTANLTGQLIGAAGKGVDVGKAMSEIGSNLMETLHPLNLFGSLLAKIHAGTKQFLEDIGEAGANVKVALGGGDQMTRSIAASTSEIKNLGFSAEEAAAAMTELGRTSAGFTQLTKQEQEAVTSMGVTMTLFGASLGDYATAFDVLEGSQKKGSTAAREMIADLTGAALALKIPPEIMIEDYGTAARVLQAHGSSMQKEFKALSAAAKATRMSVDSLLGVVEGFDTFESAGEKVGSLNALLGGAYFDTVEMVNAVEEDRVRLLLEGVQATGKSFKELGRFEQKAIANAAGITDMAEANKLFNTSLSAYDELQQAAQDGTMSLSDLSDEAYKNLSWGQKFEILLTKLTPVLDKLIIGLEKTADFLNEIVDWMKDNTWSLWVATAVAGTFALVKLAKVIKKIWAVGKAAAGGLALMKAKLFGTAAATAAQGTASAAAAPAIAAQGTAAAGAATGMAAFGVAVLKIGAGIGIAAAGIGLLGAGFSLMFEQMKDLDTTKLWSFLGWLTAFIAGAIALGALMGTGAGALMLGAGMVAIGGSITILAAALALLPTDEINALSSLFSSIGSLTSESAANLLAVGSALASFDVGEGDGIKKVTVMMEKISDIDPDAAKATEGIIKNTIELAKIKVDEKNIQFMEKLIEMLSKLNKSVEASTAAAGATGAGREVAIEVDGYRLGRVVLPYVAGPLVGKVKDTFSGGLV